MRHLRLDRGTRFAFVGVLLIAAMIIPASASAGHGGSRSPELEVVGHFDPFPGAHTVDGLTTDVWALGNFAYLGSYQEPFCSLDITGVRIIDISNTASPTQVGFIPAPPNTRINDVKVSHIETKSFKGDILIHSQEFCGGGFIPRLVSNGAVAAPGQGGISIYDVTNPLMPRALKQNFLPFQVHNTFIYQQGNKAFVVVVDDENERDVHIVDITNPNAPKEVAVTGQPDFEAIEPIDNIGVNEVFLHDVTVQQNNGRVIAYLSYWDGGLILLDITNPRVPVFLGDSDYLNPDPLSGVAPEGNSHAAWPNANGTRVLMGDEDFTKGVLTSFTFTGTSFPAVEGIFTFPVGLLPGGAFTGRVVWTGGLGCTSSEIPPAPAADAVALIQRGVCFFEEKADAAFAQGYSGFVVANDAARGDALVLMSPFTEGPYPPIPGFFVGFSTGEAMKAAGVGNLGGTLAVTGTLAFITFSVVIGAGMQKLGTLGMIKSLVPHMDLPFPIKVFLVPFIFGIELFGLLVKHGVLAVRLLANMMAGHVVLAVIVAFIAASAQSLLVWLVVTPTSVFGATALSMLELFVAFLQAYIFTFLTALFIGAAIHKH